MSDTATREQSGTAGTDAERRAALALAETLRAGGREVRVQTLWVRTWWWAPQALAAALGVAASVMSVGSPVAGIALAAAGLVVALLEVTAAAPLRRLTPARATQNVVSAPPHAGGRVTLIVTAAVDRPRRGLARRLRGSVLLTLVLALALVLACCGARAAGMDDRLAGALQLLPTLALLGCLLVLLDEAVAEPREDDRAALDAAMTLVADLDREPPGHLAVAVVLAGAGGAQAAGLRVWLRDRRRRGLTAADVAIVHLEPTPGEPPSWWSRDGLVVSSPLHPQLVRAAQAAAAADPGPAARARTRPRGTAAGIARAAGWPAIALGVGDPDDGARFARALVAALDAELAGAAPSGDDGAPGGPR